MIEQASKQQQQKKIVNRQKATHELNDDKVDHICYYDEPIYQSETPKKREKNFGFNDHDHDDDDDDMKRYSF